MSESGKVEEQLRESQRFIEAVARASASWIYVFDLDEQRATYSNRSILADLGYSPNVDTDLLVEFRRFMPAEDMSHLDSLLVEWRQLRDGQVREDEYRLRDAKGSIRWLIGREIVFSRHADGQVHRILGTLFDITERKVMELQLSEDLALLTSLTRSVPAVLYQYRRFPDGSFSVPFVSEGIRRLSEVTPEQYRKDPMLATNYMHPDDVDAFRESIRVSRETMQPWHHEYRLILARQGERWHSAEAYAEKLPDGSVLWHGYVVDVTARKRAEEESRRLANFDALTGLPNRRLLVDHIGLALASARRLGQMSALFFVDLDHFKQINDARGHSAGDAVLIQTAQRLTQLVRADDTVARLGGDEFVLLLNNLGRRVDEAAKAAMEIAERVRQQLERPYSTEISEYSSTGSIGITMFPQQQEGADDLLREADTAMYRAKTAGRNRIVFFEPAMQREVEERLALEGDLKEAIRADQLEVYVQSQVDAAGREVGAELLLRWNHPARGHVPPVQFIPIAEETGLIMQLGEFVVRKACDALVRMQAAGLLLSISINVSPRQFHRDDFVKSVRAILAETGASASGLIFEVTEGLLIQNWDDTIARISEFVALGVRFSIDDFGTGYSSLAYLRLLPLYELKIDRTFVRDTPRDASGTAIVEAILSVAKHFKLRVVAEGVETKEQAEFLIEQRCDCLQGYLFARPMPLEAWLAARLEPAS